MAQRPKKGDAHGSMPGGRLAAVAERFFSFMNSYAGHFRVHLKSQASNAAAYLKGLTTKDLKKKYGANVGSRFQAHVRSNAALYH